MKYRVKVPLGISLGFPNVCPFTDTPKPRGIVRLKKSRLLWILPLPGFIISRWAITRIKIPADRQLAVTAQWLQILMWLSLFGGIIAAFVLMAVDQSKKINGLQDC